MNSSNPNEGAALQHLRREYTLEQLDAQSVGDDPIKFFQYWFDEAVKARVPEPNAMTLATVSSSGQPSARVVLLKGMAEGGLYFYSNYESRKGQELAENPRSALAFFWPELERQVRIEGLAEQIAAEESYAYFRQRPLESRLSAWASPQSQPVRDREELEARRSEMAKRFGAEEDIPLPPFWGGYRLIPRYFEFWQGRQNRFHDRIAFERPAPDQPWRIFRLAP